MAAKAHGGEPSVGAWWHTLHDRPPFLRTYVRGADRFVPDVRQNLCDAGGSRLARSVWQHPLVMFPFDLPVVSRGFAELSSAAALVGSAAAERVAAAVGQLLGCEVRISGRALPSCPGEGGGCARLFFELPVLPGTAVFEIESVLVVSAVDRLAGGTGKAPGAIALTPVEMAVLELLALVSLEALCELEVVKLRLSPRLCRNGEPPASPLSVELELTIGDRRGRARLLMPPAAIRAFGGPSELPTSVAQARVNCSVRQGSALLSQEELSALSLGDVVLLDPNPVDLLALAEGGRIRGRLTADRFLVEGIS